MGQSVAPSRSRFVAISPDDGTVIELKNPALAALLSWLVPGLGQLYQGRRLKGAIFLASLLGTFLAGMWIGGGNVVYAQWRPGEKRWAFLGQAGIGVAAVPALVQSYRLNGSAREPLAGGRWFVPPLVRGQPVSEAFGKRLAATDPDIGPEDFRRQGDTLRFEPRGNGGQLSLWHFRLGRFFDIGTLYTMLAGLLNLLVIYDAWAGPMRQVREPDADEADADGQPPAGRRFSRRLDETAAKR